jgi:SOS-response transcriptional repressor LexA
VKGPSPRQWDTLEVLAELTARHGYPPTHRELAVRLGIRPGNSNAVYQHLEALVRKGLVTRVIGTARTTLITPAGMVELARGRDAA